jgi:hypothetical protein
MSLLTDLVSGMQKAKSINIESETDGPKTLFPIMFVTQELSALCRLPTTFSGAVS